MNITGSIEDHHQTFASTEWLLFHHEAKLEARRDFVRNLRVQPGSRILDVACGIGGWSSVFAEVVNESSIVGFDRSPSAIVAAEAYCANWVQLGRVHFLRADVNALPFEEGVFDVVFMSNCISYFDDVEIAIRSVYRSLKPLGRLVVRNFDDGLVSVYPCDPGLNLKVLWAAAQELNRDISVKGIDPFEGRKITYKLQHLMDEPIRSFADTTVFSWPFSAQQSIYIAKNVEWLGRRASKLILQEEFEAWMSLVQHGHPNNILENRAATYSMADFCAEIVKPPRSR